MVRVVASILSNGRYDIDTCLPMQPRIPIPLDSMGIADEDWYPQSLSTPLVDWPINEVNANPEPTTPLRGPPRELSTLDTNDNQRVWSVEAEVWLQSLIFDWYRRELQ